MMKSQIVCDMSSNYLPPPPCSQVPAKTIDEEVRIPMARGPDGEGGNNGATADGRTGGDCREGKVQKQVGQPRAHR